METLIIEDNYPSVQTFNYTTKLVKCISKNFQVSSISAQPVSDYPLNCRFFFKSKKYHLNLGYGVINVKEIPFLNKGVLKIFSRFLSVSIELVKTLLNGQKFDHLLVYSVHFPYMLLALIYSKITRIDSIGIWTDPPAVHISTDSFVKSKLRSLELKLSKLLMKKFKKVIVLSKHLALDFAPNSKFMVLESIFDPDFNCQPEHIERDSQQDGVIRIAYFGSVNKQYGIEKLAKIFNLINGSAELHIYGKGDYSDQLKSHVNKRIIYHGFINPDKVALEIQKYDFLINARTPSDNYVKYSFPSKVTEYMSSGRPLITTFLPGMPDEYRNYLLILDENTPSEMAKQIQVFINMNHEERLILGKRAKDFIYTKDIFSTSEKIKEFLTSELR